MSISSRLLVRHLNESNKRNIEKNSVQRWQELLNIMQSDIEAYEKKLSKPTNIGWDESVQIAVNDMIDDARAKTIIPLAVFERRARELIMTKFPGLAAENQHKAFDFWKNKQPIDKPILKTELLRVHLLYAQEIEGLNDKLLETTELIQQLLTFISAHQTSINRPFPQLPLDEMVQITINELLNREVVKTNALEFHDENKMKTVIKTRFPCLLPTDILIAYDTWFNQSKYATNSSTDTVTKNEIFKALDDEFGREFYDSFRVGIFIRSKWPHIHTKDVAQYTEEWMLNQSHEETATSFQLDDVFKVLNATFEHHIPHSRLKIEKYIKANWPSMNLSAVSSYAIKWLEDNTMLPLLQKYDSIDLKFAVFETLDDIYSTTLSRRKPNLVRSIMKNFVNMDSETANSIAGQWLDRIVSKNRHFRTINPVTVQDVLNFLSITFKGESIPTDSIQDIAKYIQTIWPSMVRGVAARIVENWLAERKHIKSDFNLDPYDVVFDYTAQAKCKICNVPVDNSKFSYEDSLKPIACDSTICQSTLIRNLSK